MSPRRATSHESLYRKPLFRPSRPGPLTVDGKDHATVVEADLRFRRAIERAVNREQWSTASQTLDAWMEFHQGLGFPIWKDESAVRRVIESYVDDQKGLFERALEEEKEGSARVAAGIQKRLSLRLKSLGEYRKRLDILAKRTGKKVLSVIRLTPPSETPTGDLAEAIKELPIDYLAWTWRPHKKQRAFIDYYDQNPKIRLLRVKTGERHGKTRGYLAYIVARAAMGFDKTLPPERPLNIIVIGPNYDHVHDVLVPEIVRFLPPGTYVYNRSYDRIEVTINGKKTATIALRSAGCGRQGIQGRSVHLLVFDEQPGEDAEVFDEGLSRIVTVGGGRLIAAFAPSVGITWAKDAIFGLDEPWASPVFCGTTYDNAMAEYEIDGVKYGGDGFLDDELISYMEGKCGGRYSPEWARRMMGEFHARHGNVWSGVTLTSHTADLSMIPASEDVDAVLCAVDFGTTAPTIALLGYLCLHHPTPKDQARLFVVECCSFQGSAAMDERIADLKNVMDRWRPHRAVIDPTPPASMGIPGRLSLIEYCARKGVRFEAADKRDWELSVMMVDDWLKARNSDARPRTLWSDRCAGKLVTAISKYYWDVKPRFTNAHPVRGESDIPDALRYLHREADHIVRLGDRWQKTERGRIVTKDEAKIVGRPGSDEWADSLAAVMRRESGLEEGVPPPLTGGGFVMNERGEWVSREELDRLPSWGGGVEF